MAKPEKAKAPVPSDLSQERLDEMRARLQEQRQEIVNMYNQDVRAGQESTDEPTEDIVDRANNSYNRELMFSISDTERLMLLQVEDALNRIEVGTYGRCTNCGNSINPLRLDAVPWARFCIDCQELAEKGLLETDH
ncbi:MAG TPA: TraR/DksA family transcriptional regulator [Thermoanaerobaculia bacterium]|nr:TraR/DksA family transcriptional regulator [Thermoanaerobaculia bacterium]